MICPDCGTHDADTGAGVLLRISGGDGPVGHCTECDYTAATREDYDRDLHMGEYGPQRLTHPQEAYVKTAKDMYETDFNRPGSIEIDEGAEVEKDTRGGAWVRAWVFVDDKELE